MKRVVVVVLGIMVMIFGMSGLAQAYSTTYTETFTPLYPTKWFDPPHSSSTSPIPYAYHLYDGIPDTTEGDHTMKITASQFEAVLYLYEDSFSSSAPSTNLLTYTTDYATGIEWDLTSGTNYFLVTTTLNPGTSGQFTVEIAPSAVIPIPGAVWLLGSGLIALAGWRRKVKN